MQKKFLKPKNLKKGDKIAIVSTSCGTIGEEYAAHEVKLGKRRLEEYSLIPIIMLNSMKGVKYLMEHPEKRAEDLLNAFKDISINAIITANSGVDPYKTIPFLVEKKEIISTIRKNVKIFTGYGDATINHFMFFN